MVTKPAATRKANQLAGTRLPLPGQDKLRESWFRAELTAYYAPVGLLEQTWINDLAHCYCDTKVTRAHIAGYAIYKLKQAWRDVQDNEQMFRGTKDWKSIYSAHERELMAEAAERDFLAPDNTSLLDDRGVALLLARMTPSEAAFLRLLKEDLRSGLRERDRIINQFDRRRRQAIRDSIEWAEAKLRIEAAQLRIEAATNKARARQRELATNADPETAHDSCPIDDVACEDDPENRQADRAAARSGSPACRVGRKPTRAIRADSKLPCSLVSPPAAPPEAA